jgi:octaprenyl-diphosphate synthase
LIYALNNSSKSEKRFIINTVKNHNTDGKRVAKVIDMVKEKGGIDYAISRMIEYQEKSLLMLDSYPDNDAKKSLKELVNFVIARKK